MKCSNCKKNFDIESLHYDPYTNSRYCDKCWKKYKDYRFRVRAVENKKLIEDMIARREEMMEEDEEE